MGAAAAAAAAEASVIPLLVTAEDAILARAVTRPAGRAKDAPIAAATLASLAGVTSSADTSSDDAVGDKSRDTASINERPLIGVAVKSPVWRVGAACV